MTTRFAFIAKLIITLCLLIPTLSLSQTWRDTLQYARISGMGLSMNGYVGDSTGNAIVLNQIRSHLIAERTRHHGTSTNGIQSVFVVTTTNDTGNGSFRAAIDSANTSSIGLDEIIFNIPPGGPQIITPQSHLPNIIDPLIIDGTTQPGYAGNPMIWLNCVSLGPFNALTILAGNSTVKGLVISNLIVGGSAIVLDVFGGNVIAGNFFGTDITGTARRDNIYNGVIAYCPNNMIGGTTPEERNIFAGQGLPCIGLGPGGMDNVVQGNFIGTDLTGRIRLGTETNGIVINGSINDSIGGLQAGARNIISGCKNGAPAFAIVGVAPGLNGTSGIQVLGNYIGTDITGMISLGNTGIGLFILNSPDNVIGGTTVEARNIISGNSNGEGIKIEGSGATNNIVQGNFIGVKADGVSALGNLYGIVIDGAPRNFIGRAVEGATNVISCNQSVGIAIANSGAYGNRVFGNEIGTNLAENLDLGNGSVGIYINNASRDSIDNNVIEHNRSTAGGVYVAGGTGNYIVLNRIYLNAGLGIDLAPQGLARNDSLDEDAGSNNLVNFPLLDSAAVSNGFLKIHGRYHGTPNSSFRFDFYSSPAYDPSHFGEGATPLVNFHGVTDAAGNFHIDIQCAFSSTDQFITATATDSSGSTSEFSQVLDMRDSDGDGIMDSWETSGWGIDVNSDSTIDLDLYALGARPDHKDLFVEIDAMAGYVPPVSALEMVKKAFSIVPNAYIENPDNQPGVHLYYVLDDTTIPPADFPNTWSDFDLYKEAFFGTDSEKASDNSAQILAAKNLVFRYGLWARTYATGDTVFSSGISELRGGLGGNDFMVTFGAWNATKVDSIHAGTFMHEFGHTLGLGHGGGNGQQFKPNYISVMNYTWQVPYSHWKTPTSWRLDYSSVALDPLDELHLNEQTGLNPPPGVYTYTPVPFLDSTGHIHYAVLGPGSNRVNWSGVGDSTNIWTWADVNDIESDPRTNSIETLTGYADWPNLKYNFRQSPAFAPGVHNSPMSATPEEPELTKRTYDFLNTLPPPKPHGCFVMDGELDTSATLISSSSGIKLYACYESGQLYLATDSAVSQAGDVCIFVSDSLRPLRSAPLGKLGEAAGWSGFLWHKSADNASGWSNFGEGDLANITVDTIGTVLEGVLDVRFLLGRDPKELFVAIAKYGSESAGVLLGQVPTGNGDGNIDASELFPISNPRASIVSVRDVPNDQGREVRIRWNKSPMDTAGAIVPIASYSVWRKTPVANTSAGKRQEGVVALDDSLELLATIPAVQSPQYNVVVPTLADSSSSGIPWTKFIVKAHSSVLITPFVSNLDSGYSVDNLTPGVPSAPMANVLSSTSARAQWRPNHSTTDIGAYHLYRSTTQNFTIGPANLIGSTNDTVFTDNTLTSATSYWYRVTSVDLSGNESMPTAPFAIEKIKASVKVFLEGPFDSLTHSMKTTLRTHGYLAAHFATVPIPSIAVDSINIEMRNNASSTPTDRQFRPAWLLADGTIRGFSDTTKPYVEFDTLAGGYHLIVHHRNHLAIMTAAPQAIGYSVPSTPYNFTTSQTQAYTQAQNPMNRIGTVYVMVAGDANPDGQIAASDIDNMIRLALGQSGYRNADIDLNGQVQHSDINRFVRVNLGRVTQVPSVQGPLLIPKTKEK